jgi:hypothetical protein
MSRLVTAVLIGLCTVVPAFATDTPPLSPELQPLDKAAGKWTWDVDCGWSASVICLCRRPP